MTETTDKHTKNDGKRSLYDYFAIGFFIFFGIIFVLICAIASIGVRTDTKTVVFPIASPPVGLPQDTSTGGEASLLEFERPQKITIHSEEIITTFKVEEPEPVIIFTTSEGVLTASKGTNNGPSGKETWYNLDMTGVISTMRTLGFSESEYPYWIREDGAKMLGNYVMVAADMTIRPKGTVLATSLGYGLVCDTGDFAATNQTQIDIATNW